MLDVVEGDVVTLSVLSDSPATLHVHEYEQQVVVPLAPGDEATTTFIAERDNGQIDDEVLREVLRGLDLEEATLNRK